MTSWQQRERAQQTLSRETGYVRKPHGDRLRVAIAFPNTYWVGMSNLGFQTVYRLFNAQDDIVCERVFLPPKQELAELLASKTPLLTLESQTPVSDFDVLAFSVSFEWDYVNVLTLMRLAGMPRYAAERTDRHPLVVIGGAVTFVNPDPLAPERGFYVPTFYEPKYDMAGALTGFATTAAGASAGAPVPVRKAAVKTT